MINLKNKKVIIADMDGTLTKSRRPVTKTMADLIAKLSNHYDFCIVTGGKLELIQSQVTDHINEKHGVIKLFPTSGNQYWRFFNGFYENQYIYRMEDDDVSLIINAIIKLCVNESIRPVIDDLIEFRGSQVTFSITGRSAPHELKDIVDPDGLIRSQYVLQLKEYLGEKANLFSIKTGGTTSIDFTYTGHDKGFALEKILEITGLKKEDCIFFGDKCAEGGNDYEIAKEIDFVCVEDEQECEKIFVNLADNL